MSDPRDHEQPESEDEEDFNPAPADMSDDEAQNHGNDEDEPRKSSPARNGGGEDDEDEEGEDEAEGGNDDEAEEDDEDEEEEDEIQVRYSMHSIHSMPFATDEDLWSVMVADLSNLGWSPSQAAPQQRFQLC